jgi:hypothetical protein
MTRPGVLSSDRDEHSAPWVIWGGIVEHGMLAGILGASVVAVWYFIVDTVARGMPFYTPSLLGSVVFAGADPSKITGIDGAMIFAYTGAQGLLFLTAGMLLAWMFYHCEQNPQVGFVLLLLFITFEAILWGVGVSIIPALAGAVGAWTILVANVTSAIAMFTFLLRRHPHTIERLREAWNE